MDDTAIRVENLSKRYRIGERKSYGTLRETLAGIPRSPLRRILSRDHTIQSQPSKDGFIWALKDVSFEVQQGEVIGIIGRNGAGKTTLLKVLSRITKPTQGMAEIHGRVGSLLEVGTGFHPELTGRENIYLNGAILGMRRAEIQRKFDEIVDFAEIEKFLDTPVKRYSSGMYVRLAFAVAAHLEPEILLVDEVLAVGDAAFQKKCVGKMGDIARGGRTVLFVSHNMAAVQSLCDLAILLEQGNVVTQGYTHSVIEKYLYNIHQGNGVFELEKIFDRSGSGEARIDKFRVIDSTKNTTTFVRMGEQIGFEIDYQSKVPLDRASFQIGVYTGLMQNVCLFNSQISDFIITAKKFHYKGRIRCVIPYVNFTAGRYYVNLAITNTSNGKNYDHITQAGYFDVIEADVFNSGKCPSSNNPCYFISTWSNI